jgi:myo-inositol-1(or 4)-monophosphatase
LASFVNKTQVTISKQTDKIDMSIIHANEWETIRNNVIKTCKKVLSNKRLDDTGSFTEREIKLEVDITLHNLIKNIIASVSSLNVLSEESPLYEINIFNPATDTAWIIDPLDGSLNYKRGIPFYSTSICLWSQGAPLLGFIYDFSRDIEYYNTIHGEVYAGKKIISKKINHLRELKASGIPSFSSADQSLEMLKCSLKDYKKLRLFGCASLSIAFVIENKIDCYQELGIKIWDVAAGMALAQTLNFTLESKFNSNINLDLDIS